MKGNLIIRGFARGQQRPKFSTFGGHVRAYDSQESVDFKDKIKLFFLQKYPNFIPTEKPVKFGINVYKEIPKSYSRKKTRELLEKETPDLRKPDMSNIFKAVEDALTGYLYKDDRQIWGYLDCKKVYAENEYFEIFWEIGE